MSLVIAPYQIVASLEDARVGICPDQKWSYQPRNTEQAVLLQQYGLSRIKRSIIEQMCVAGGVNERQIREKLRRRLNDVRHQRTLSCRVKQSAGIGIALVVRERFRWIKSPYTHDAYGKRFTVGKSPAMRIANDPLDSVVVYKTNKSKTLLVRIMLKDNTDLFLSPWSGDISPESLILRVVALQDMMPDMYVDHEYNGIELPMVSIKIDRQPIDWLLQLTMVNSRVERIVEGAVQSIKIAIGPDLQNKDHWEPFHMNPMEQDSIYRLHGQFIGWVKTHHAFTKPHMMFYAPKRVWRNPGRLLVNHKSSNQSLINLASLI